MKRRQNNEDFREDEIKAAEEVIKDKDGSNSHFFILHRLSSIIRQVEECSVPLRSVVTPRLPPKGSTSDIGRKNTKKQACNTSVPLTKSAQQNAGENTT